jgi:hypothetical protein
VLKRLGVEGLMSGVRGMRFKAGKQKILRRESTARRWRKRKTHALKNPRVQYPAPAKIRALF